jgi:hypothetical protein
MDINTILIGMLAGSIGLGYFIFGKKQSKPVPMFCGVGLMAYSYFFSDIWTLLGVGLLFIIAPIFIKT